ncbi:MAG: efflux transporter periplasmic adaptor subunit [Rhodospirillaceae bacterium]|nr:efflux transporter periplasmic adaptor subunit [Rhodospirillaceae bacterium]
MKKQHLIAVGIALAATAWVASGVMDGSSPEPETIPVAKAQKTAEETPEVRVRTMTAEPHHRFVTTSGHTAASRTLDVRTETAGRVVEIAVEEGSVVSKGDLLVRLAMDERRDRLEEAKATLHQRELEYEAGSKLGEKGYRAEVTVAGSAADLAAAKARVKEIELDIARPAIRAPFDGVIEAVPVEIGAVIAIGAEVATLVDLDPLKAVTNIPEQAISEVEVGTLGKVHLVSGAEVEGIVSYVSRVADTGTRTFRVELEVANADRHIPAGMTGEISLPAGQVLAHKVTPALLSLSTDGVVGVKTVDPENRVVFHPATIVEDQPDGVWLGGLPETIRVITVGQEFVDVGQAVRPVTVTAESEP